MDDSAAELSDGAPSETSYAYDDGSGGGGSDKELTSSQQKRSRVEAVAVSDASAFAGGARYASMTVKQLQSRMENVVSGASLRLLFSP